MAAPHPTISSILVDAITVQLRTHPGIPLLFVSGAQGIGKSTALMAVDEAFSRRIATLSIDDFYHTKSKRARLGVEVSPLAEVRGPPGTHDLALLNQVIDALLIANDAAETRIPVFDKRTDDRVEETEWITFSGRPRAILLEGWCVGAVSDPYIANSLPLNDVEIQDTRGEWRLYQDKQLAGPYARLWARADAFLYLTAESFEQVLAWRTQQEETTLALEPGTLSEQRRAWVENFIQHYERITKRLLSGGRRRGYAVSVSASRVISNPPKPAPELLVFSDLDGTLLDHHDYSFSAANEALAALKERNAALILASSKTAAEMQAIRAEIGFEHCPGIVENGGGILPVKSIDVHSDQPPHDEIIKVLNTAPKELREEFAGFSDWTIEQVSNQTGLPLDAAARAKIRQFSEPGLWSGSDEALEAFKVYLAEHGIFGQRGGRFFTLSHGKTKADQMMEIASQFCPTPIIALGDAPNDIEMIETAHRGVIIKNANGRNIERRAGETVGKVIRSERPGPAGWNRAILDFIDLLDKQ
ncbi:MAG: HAD-IIB family hydrolase [Pseudomonadota bacterium]